jgi:hypothetical protein
MVAACQLLWLDRQLSCTTAVVGPCVHRAEQLTKQAYPDILVGLQMQALAALMAAWRRDSVDARQRGTQLGVMSMTWTREISQAVIQCSIQCVGRRFSECQLHCLNETGTAYNKLPILGTSRVQSSSICQAGIELIITAQLQQFRIFRSRLASLTPLSAVRYWLVVAFNAQ